MYSSAMSEIRPTIIYDDAGEPVAAVVPYREWLALHQPNSTPNLSAQSRVFYAGEMLGKLSWTGDPLEYQTAFRREP
jgi:hypothetical protein